MYKTRWARARPAMVGFSAFFGSWAFFALAASSGPVNYWQQDVAYEIDVTLNAEDHTLSGREVLTYTNNSPDTLSYVWFHLYPNAYKDGKSLFDKDTEKRGFWGPGAWSPKDRGFIEIRSFTSDGEELGRRFKPGDGTEMQVDLFQPLVPGGTVTFDIDFVVKIPKGSGTFAQRMQYRDRHYEISQWYPKVVVYDAEGWHPDGYRLLGEFYGEFGTFDVRITVPENMTVAATGNLMGPASEIARMDSLARFAAGLDSLRAAGEKGQIKHILKRMRKEDLSPETKTLHYHADDVHDFAWAGDKDFILKRGSYKDVTINVFVRPKHEKDGREAAGFTHDALEHYSRHYGEYAYGQMSVVEGDFGGGMEYPMLTIVGFDWPSFFRLRELVIVHETGHNWFHGMLGSNEMAEAWLDESINSFAEHRYLEEKYGPVGNLTKWPSWLGFMPELSDRYYHTLEYYMIAANQAEEPLLTRVDEFQDEVAYIGLIYGKGARMMAMLRAYLGDEVFDRVMQTYFKEYKFRHPTTEDFIEVAERVSGERLGWFFNQWLKTTGQCDFKIERVRKRKVPTADGTGRRVEVTVSHKGECRMPVNLVVKQKEGDELSRQWDGSGGRRTFSFEIAEPPSYVEIDPEDNVLEVNKWNNRSRRKVTFHPIADFPSFDSYQIFYGPSLWYDNDVDGWRPGLWLNGGQFRTLGPVPGSYEWTLGSSYGTRSDKVNYHVFLRHPVHGLGRFTRFEARVKDLEGRITGNVGLCWRWSRYVFGAPELKLRTDFIFRSVYDLGYLEPGDWSKGQTVGGLLDLAYSTFCWRHPVTWRLNIRGAHESLGSDFNFLRTTAVIEWKARWTRRVRTDLRLFGGYIEGTPPLHERLYLSGGLLPAGPLGFVADGKGRYAPQNYYYVPGDANLRGYHLRHLADKVAGSINLDVSLPYLPAKLFYGVGSVWDKMDHVSWGNLRHDFGVALYLGPVSFHFPFWVSDPAQGESEFEWRWMVSVGGELTVF